MPRKLLSIARSVPLAVSLIAGLTACALEPVHLAAQLDSVPLPAPATMAKTRAPNCSYQTPARVAARGAQPKSSSTASDFEADVAGAAGADTPNAPAPDAGPSKVTLKSIEQERDCYRRAEQIARNRLNQLQASTADTVVALDELKHQLDQNNQGVTW